ncbi:WD40-repeat-containing domain protein [Aspergillus crustosus]
MVAVATEYISVGGNRHPAAADWDVQSGILAYGADNNVALWSPQDESHRGVYAVLVGHADKVSAVKFYTCPTTGTKLLLTGSADRTVRIWRAEPIDQRRFAHALTLTDHTGSINAIATNAGLDIIAIGAADGTVKIWRVGVKESINGELLQNIPTRPHYFPLALALAALPTDTQDRPAALAIAGTTNIVQIYAAEKTDATPNFKASATLSGHEAWVRSLSFTTDVQSKPGDLLLSSASQDKYVRLWRLHRGETPSSAFTADEEDPVMGGFEPTLSNKAHQFGAAGSRYSMVFEALLFGNEDWIYTAAWNPNPERQQLLTASADNTLTIWEQDTASGVWLSTERMGELSVQKGSTTATGSTGGFWIGLWAPDGHQVVSLGRTGSWRAWKYDIGSDIWVQSLGITGHVRSANGIQWEPSGGYLLSTSADQTTRLHAQWLRDGQMSWHEFSRPQIHGYDLNCIETLGPERFVSGAEEKLLRVFNEPRPIAQLLEKLSGFTQNPESELPDTAQIPVLGLSNQAVGEELPVETDTVEPQSSGQVHANQALLSTTNQPPLEDQLSRYTLWPEHEKLYGHGYEISAVAVSHDRTLIATACKASSIDHAVVRLYDTSDWHEIRPSLAAHTLTITGLAFSIDDKYLLSVGRDRQWAVYSRSKTDPSVFTLTTSNPKGHSRMILGADWAPVLESQHPIFATAGRDKSIKLWQVTKESIECKATIPARSSVTAVSFLPYVHNGVLFLATGEDDGKLKIHQIKLDGSEPSLLANFDREQSPSKAITGLSWRPLPQSGEAGGTSVSFKLAVASEDTSVRIYGISRLVS